MEKELIINHDGDTWRVLSIVGYLDGKFNCHLASTTRFRGQGIPRMSYYWVDGNKLQGADDLIVQLNMESVRGYWVRDEDVRKLEKQVTKTLDSLKTCTELLMVISMDPDNSPFPLAPVSSMRPQILDAISVAVEVITEIEGEQE